MSALTLLTGATGFIGRHVLTRLLEDGERVRVLVRRPELLPPVVAARVEIVRGDLRDPPSLARAVAGADTVLHLAACARAWSPDPNEFRAVNLRAVAALLEAVEKYGIGRLVHVSTVLTLTRPRDRALTPYEETKLAGERLVERSGHGIIVHPTRVYGPGPLNDANGVTKVIALYLAGRFRVRLDDGDVQANYVHVGDVAGAILSAARRGVTGAHYLLYGENASMRGLLEKVARLSGTRRRVLRVRPQVAVAAAGAAELAGRIGVPVPITRNWVRLFLEDQRVVAEDGWNAPGYAPRGLDVGLAQTLEWLRSAERSAA